MASDCLSSFYSLLSGNYGVIATVFCVLVLSFLIPDISRKLQASEELKNVKKVLDKMSDEVKQAEVACLTVADEVCCFHCSMHDDTTETSKELRNLSVCTSHCMRTTQSEPGQVEKKFDFFSKIFFPNRNPSQKEITIMSIVYTDSFDAQKPIIVASK